MIRSIADWSDLRSGHSRWVAKRRYEGDEINPTAVRTLKLPRFDMARRAEFSDVLEDGIAGNLKPDTRTVHAQRAARNVLKLGEQGCGALRLHTITLLRLKSSSAAA